ncbi:hypothetical protein AJ80_05260 [Polytolypa hystricis UAMH7299]|uniref:Uncharacterized protein n=1 Tax=Polytolypa hystricis (strain UAMH7299) TaxID=1447883 RepID=A0A2B7Y6I5_POLH7|nr:hypothetical protein AJ80_05260 [Polytolypa hystricis UAMH7299]
MGCGSSKQQDMEPTPPSVPLKSRPGTRAQSRGGEPQRRTAPPSKNPSTAPSRRGHEGRGTRTGTHSRKGSTPGSRRSQPRSAATRSTGKSSSALSPLEEQPVPEDRVITNETTTLSTFISLHCKEFYRTQIDNGGQPIRKRMARVIISKIIEGNGNERTVANELAREFQPYAKSPADEKKRADNILSHCEIAANIASLIRRHGADWTFSWDGEVEFPSLMKDRVPVRPGGF